MNNQSPFLSICIPTYNQPNSLKKLLESLLFQITEEIEIVIRDDSTDDISKRIIFEMKDLKNIRYFHGKKEGLDIAILFLTNEAKGKYIWWIGDDVLETNAISKVLDFLKSHTQTSFLYINSRQANENFSKLKYCEIKKFHNSDEALVDLADMLGFISVTIFRREKAIPFLLDAKMYIGTAWVNLFIILSVLSHDGELYKMNEYLIISDSRDPAQPWWYDGFTVFAINFFNILKVFEGKFSRLAIRKTLSRNFDGIWKGILVYRAKGYTHGLGAKTVTICVIMRYYWTFSGFWIAFPFLIMPRSIIKFLYKFYLGLRSTFSYA